MVLAEIKDLYVLTEDKIEELESTIEQFKDKVKCAVLESVNGPINIHSGITIAHEVTKILENTVLNKHCLKIAIIIGENINGETNINLKLYDSIPKLTNNIYTEETLC